MFSHLTSSERKLIGLSGDLRPSGPGKPVASFPAPASIWLFGLFGLSGLSGLSRLSGLLRLSGRFGLSGRSGLFGLSGRSGRLRLLRLSR